jgi:hypothetical protein
MLSCSSMNKPFEKEQDDTENSLHHAEDAGA